MSDRHNSIAGFTKKAVHEKSPKKVLGEVESNKASIKPKKAGRKPKKESERSNKGISVYFTQSEKDELEKLAGDVPLSTFLRKRLEENNKLTNILS